MINKEKDVCQFIRQFLSPLIKKASIKKIPPGTLYIEYQMRVPLAYLGDYTNTALDEEGYLFPFSPFFTPKKLPIIYLGLQQDDAQWGMTLKQDQRLQLAFDLLKKHGVTITPEQFNDCGLMIYREDQPVLAGGSGCGCSAAVTYGHLLNRMKRGEFKKMLIVATGALLSPMSYQQKETIPCIAHAVSIEAGGEMG